MGGLRALCCSKQDKSDDSQDTPVRLTQPPPQKSTQNAPVGAKKRDSSTDVTPVKSVEENPAPADLDEKKSVEDKLAPAELSEEKPAPRDLWKEAYDNLDPSRKPYVAANGVSATDAINQVVKDTKDKYAEWKKGGLKIHQKNGDDIDIGDYAEKILGAALKASEVISFAVSFDPTGHASSAWTVISFGMNIAQNRLDRRNAIFEASKYLAETLSYYALVDTTYRNKNVGSDHQVDEVLLGVYSAILEFSAEVKKAQDENAAIRTFHSFLPLTDQPLQTLKDTINSQAKLAKKWTDLAADLADEKRAKEHLEKTDAILTETKNLAARALNEDEEKQLKWISTASYSDRQRDLQGKKTENTGIWLLDSPEYTAWKTVPGSLLWLPGISGCGKSVLCSTVIQDLETNCSLDPSKFLGYWYFQFGNEDTKSVEAMARSLIRQLSRSPLTTGVKNLWDIHGRKGSEPGFAAISDALENLLSSISGEVYLVLDALDECPQDGETKERKVVLSLLSDLFKQQNTKIHILVTSRPLNDIEKGLPSFTRIDLQEELAKDVETFATLAVTQGDLEEWGADIHKLILDELLSSKERRFRWAELQIQALEKCRDEEAIKRALKKIPRTLEDTYRQVLDSIDPDDHIYARQILITVCLTPVVLDVQTVANMAGLRFANDVIKICTTSFLNVFEGKVQLAHFSVQEFLILSEDTDQHHFCQFTAVNGHTHLAEKTADILLGQTDVLTQATAKDKTAFLYAAKHWNTHLTAAGGMDALKPELQDKISRLFTEPNVYLNWVRAADSDDRNLDNEWSKMLEECQPPIHRASSMGLGRVVENLLEQGADPFQKFPPTRTSKYSQVSSYVMASINGQLDVLQVLLDKRSPLEGKLVEAILAQLSHKKAGKVKLESILQTLWDQNLLRGESNDNPDEIGEHVLAATMRNRRSGVEILHVLLDWQPRVSIPITPTVLLSAIRYGPDTLEILLDTCDAHVTPEVLEGLDQDECGTMKFTSLKAQSLCLLAVKRPTELPIDEGLLLHFAKFLDLEAMTSLIQARKSDICVTEYHLEKAAKNQNSGGVFGLLWPYRESGIVISEDMLCKAAANDDHCLELMGFMQQHMEPGMRLSEDTVEKIMSTCEEGVTALKMIMDISSPQFSVSEDLVGIICARGDSMDLLSVLSNKGMNIPITENVLAYAASNELQGPAIFEYLAKIHQKPLPVTELALMTAVDNSEFGDKILEILLQDASPSLLTDDVFKNACGNGRAIRVLLDQGRKDPPIEKILEKLKYGDPSSRDVIYALLEHNVLNVDESVVVKLATNFDALDALISRKPDLPITENALIAGIRDHRSIRIMMGVQGSASLVTENVLESAVNVKTYESQKVLEIISHRQGGINITERVLSAGIKSQHESLLAWLLENTSESVVKTFFMAEKWQSDSLWTSTTRCALLKAFAQKEQPSMTEAMLQNWPFTPESKEYFALDWLVRDEKTEKIKTFATEKAAEIFVERCCNEDIEKFLTENQITVTDHLIQLGEKNPGADHEKLTLFLEQRRDSPGVNSEPSNGDMDVPEK